MSMNKSQIYPRFYSILSQRVWSALASSTRLLFITQQWELFIHFSVLENIETQNFQ